MIEYLLRAMCNVFNRKSTMIPFTLAALALIYAGMRRFVLDRRLTLADQKARAISIVNGTIER